MSRIIPFDTTYSRIEWKIENIFSLSGRAHESRKFRFLRSEWILVLEKVQTQVGTERFRVVLRETKAKEVLAYFVSRAFIVDQNYTPQFLTERVCERTTEYCNACVWSMDVTDLRRKEDVLSKDNIVTFVFILLPKSPLEYEDREVSTQTSASTDPLPAFECLSLDLQHLLDDSIPPDVTLKCGDRTIPAHRNILSARSDVFLAMFRSDVAESRRGVIEIPHMEPAILDQLLQFIYSCKLPNMTVDTAPQFYEAADKYGVESLREVCSAFMAENLTEGNACCILLLADAHSDCDLKDGVVSFIVRTELCEKDEIWLQFRKDHPILAVEVLNRVRKSLP